jgi:flagellar hook-associated protein 1 FlgK
MSLFGSIQIAGNSLQATQLGLQVTGQNIANANTPGYLREQLSQIPAAGQQWGNFTIGLGVQVQGVVQQVDELLEGRLRNANSDAQNSSTQADTYQKLEGVTGDLTDTGLGASLNNFFSSISDVLNQPSSVPVRNQAVLQGESLVSDISSLANRTASLRADINKQVDSAADQINTLLNKVATLNTQIAAAQSGNPLSSNAVGLTDQRNQALQDLSQLTDITVEKQPDQTVNVLAGGQLLVNNGTFKRVTTVSSSDRGQSIDTIEVVDSQSPLKTTSGQVAGLYASRDQILGGYLDQLNTLTGTVINEFNKAYSSGQGLNGYTQATSQNAVNNPNVALDASGLPFTPVNGSFQLLVKNTTTGQTSTTNIQVQLHGLDSDTSLNDLAQQINAVAGVTATVKDGKLSIQSTDSGQQFAFANDTSGALSALGINTFFTGKDAFSIGINQAVIDDPSKFAASQGGIGADSSNAATLANFINQPLESQNNATLATLYDRVASSVAQGSALATSIATTNTTFQQTLSSQHLSVSGVNIDEEAVNLIQYQATYQATAKYISTLNNLLNVLVQI